MNRLHLPPPFGDPELFPGTLRVISEFPCTNKVTVSSEAPETSTQLDAEPMDLSGSSESELSSDHEDHGSASITQSRSTVRKPKRLRRQAYSRNLAERAAIPKSDTGTLQTTSLSDIFDAPSQSAKLSLHIPQRLVSSENQASCADHVGGFGVLYVPPRPLRHSHNHGKDNGRLSSGTTEDEFQLRKSKQVKDQLPSLPELDQSPSPTHTDEAAESLAVQSFSLNELRARRLTSEERANYTVFSRNYSPGDPTSRLYIKNIAPSVTDEDLYRVFGAFQFGPVTDLDFHPLTSCNPTERFSIQLLTSGRMKGQAFVSLSCELTATQALEATNGLLLHDRPIVVQFARSAKAKVDEKSLISVD